jgi:apolipoprotein N-acyltransferase
MTTYGKMHPVFSVVAFLLLVGYLSLFFAAATWAACRLRERLGLSPLLTLPVLWVALEFLRSFLLSGFPWASLGYSQQSHLALIQSVDLCGIYGLSFLLVLVNATLAGTVLALARRSLPTLPWKGLAVAAVFFATNLGYGYFRLEQDLDGRERTLSVAMVQGNIDQSAKWRPANQQSTVSTYRDLSLAAARANKTDLLIWPESATPFYFQDGGPLSDAVVATARTADAWLLFGSPAYEFVNRRPRYLNSAFLLSGDGQLLGRSDKVHLVPFGEYVPLGKYLPFIDKLVDRRYFSGRSALPMNGAEVGGTSATKQYFLNWPGGALGAICSSTSPTTPGSAVRQRLSASGDDPLRYRKSHLDRPRRQHRKRASRLLGITAQSPIFKSSICKEVGWCPADAYTRFDVFPALFLLLSVVWLVKTRRRYARS